jgi:ActR/RegA family two-component response regulator
MHRWGFGMSGRHILIAEDEYLVVADMAAAFEAMGAHVLGPAATVRDALDIAERAVHLDAAVVDIKLQGGGMAFPVAEALLKRGTPFVFATGYDESATPPHLGQIVACQKPVNSLQIAHALFGR